VPENAVVELAYFQLPRAWDAAEVEVPKHWDHAVLDGADETAGRVITGILAEQFWPPAPAPDYFDEFAAICLDGLEAPPVTDEDDEDSA
jgi:hypothetical protein